MGDHFIGLFESTDLVGLSREPFHSLHAANTFGEGEDELVEELAIAGVTWPQTRGEGVSYPPERPGHRKASQGKARMNPPHEREIGAEREEHVDPLQQHTVDEQASVLRVPGD